MKIRRYKHARRVLSLYRNTFGFHEPYQVLVDGTFCQAALAGKIQLKEQLPKYLGGSIQLVTTRCIVKETEELEAELKGAILILKRFSQRNCGHKRERKSAVDCLLSLIGESNEHHYIVATQDEDLQTSASAIPGAPLLHIIRNTIVLKNPSEDTKEKVEEIVRQQTDLTPHETAVLEELDSKLIREEVKRRKRKRPGGPNPLSIKKRKRLEAPVLGSTRNVRRNRKRRERERLKRCALSLKVAKLTE